MTGRDLDRQVAEKIMGYTPPEHPKTKAIRMKACMTHSSYDTFLGLPNGGGIDLPPKFSTDPAAMMQVIEAMRENGQYISISCLPRSTTWAVQIHNDPDDEQIVTFASNQLSEAVCLAALAAVDAMTRRRAR